MSSIQASLKHYLTRFRHPILCVGSMSKNCVDAVIEYANHIRRPIPLLASRRQIECREFGGGYVNSWTTEDFSAYVRARDKGFVPLCRDQGGPWQGAQEEGMGLKQALERAGQSIDADLSAGFNLIHLDASMKEDETTERSRMGILFHLYEQLVRAERDNRRVFEVEIGAHEKSSQAKGLRSAHSALQEIKSFCSDQNMKTPLFWGVRLGTEVTSWIEQKPALRELKVLAESSGVFLKEHQADYLSDGTMSLRRELGFGALNIGPELGVFETKSLLSLCHEHNLSDIAESLLEIFFKSEKWKDLISTKTSVTDIDKALLAGYFNFNRPEVIDLKSQIQRALRGTNVDLDEYLKSHIKVLLTRFAWNLGYFGSWQIGHLPHREN